jgi:integrase
MSWTLWYRTKAGKPRSHVLGRYPEMSLKRARAAAREVMAKVDLERDPMGEKLEARRHAEEESRCEALAKGTTVDALARRCLGALRLRPKTLKEWRRLVEVEIVPAFEGRQAAEVSRREIREWAAEIAHRPAPYTANRAFELLRRIYSWGIETDLLTSTPFVKLARPAAEERSERVLSTAEIRAVWLALDDIGTCYADAVKLLFLTGVRRDMVQGMRRSEVEELDGFDPRWVIPGGFTGRSKSGRTHVVSLSAPAVEIIRRRLDVAYGQALFPPTREAQSESMHWSSRFVQDLRTRAAAHYGAPMVRWTIHNLRHTVGTHMREDLRVSSEVVSLILGHTPPGPAVSRVYNRAELLPERRAALMAWAGWLLRDVSDARVTAAVIRIGRR